MVKFNFPSLNLKKGQYISLGILLFLAISIPIGLYLSQKTQIFKPRAVESNIANLNYVVKPVLLIPIDWKDKISQSDIGQYKSNTQEALKVVQNWYSSKLNGHTFNIDRSDFKVVYSLKPLNFKRQTIDSRNTADLFFEIDGGVLIPTEDKVIQAIWLIGSEDLDATAGGRVVINHSAIFEYTGEKGEFLKNRALGILAHELGHTFGLKHPCTILTEDDCPPDAPRPLPELNESLNSIMKGPPTGFPNLGFNNSIHNPEVGKVYQSPFINPNHDNPPPGTIIPTPIITPTPIATIKPSESPTPTPGQQITLSGCQEITQSGNYMLDRDLTNLSGQPCLKIHDTTNVNLNCNGHKITENVTQFRDDEALKISNLTNFSIQSCRLQGINNTESLVSPLKILTITNSKNGVIQNNQFTKNIFEVNNSQNLSIKNNAFDGWYVQHDSNGITIEDNNLFNTFDRNQTPGMIYLENGYNNKILNNTINGGWDGIDRDFQHAIYSDDGILLQDERNDLVQGNQISNNWDCGIETIGFIQNTIFDSNTSKNSPICGIGGWYSNS